MDTVNGGSHRQGSGSAPGTQAQASSQSQLSWKSPAAGIGLLILLGFAWFTWYLLHHTSAMGTQWDRIFTTYQGIEAIVIAAVGAIMGGGLQEVRVRQTQRKLDSAESNVQKLAGAGDGIQAIVNSAKVLERDFVQNVASDVTGQGAPEFGTAARAQAQTTPSGQALGAPTATPDGVLRHILALAAEYGWTPTSESH